MRPNPASDATRALPRLGRWRGWSGRPPMRMRPPERGSRSPPCVRVLRGPTRSFARRPGSSHLLAGPSFSPRKAPSRLSRRMALRSLPLGVRRARSPRRPWPALPARRRMIDPPPQDLRPPHSTKRKRVPKRGAPGARAPPDTPSRVGRSASPPRGRFSPRSQSAWMGWPGDLWLPRGPSANGLPRTSSAQILGSLRHARPRQGKSALWRRAATRSRQMPRC